MRNIIKGVLAFALMSSAVGGVATLAGGSTSPVGAVSAPAAPAMGVQFHAMWSDYTDAQRLEVLDKMAAAGVRWVRIDMGWASFQEVSRDRYSGWTVKLADSVVDAARARGIQVLATIWRTPAWANAGAGVMAPPSDPADFGRYAGWMADHFRGRVAAWEIWNEPNHTSYFHGTVEQYVQLLKAAYPAIKAADPASQVLIGGPSMNDDRWLTKAYDAGAQGSFDVVATHPYMGFADAPPESPDDGNVWTIAHVAAVKRLMDARGDGDKKIWFTEFGWSSHPNWPGVKNWERGVTAQQQGEYLVRAIEYVRKNYPYVTHMFWFKDRNGDSGDPQHDNYGLLERDLAPKPAYEALKAHLGRLASSDLPTPAVDLVAVDQAKPQPQGSPEVEVQPAPTVAKAESGADVPSKATPKMGKATKAKAKAKARAKARWTPRRSYRHR